MKAIFLLQFLLTTPAGIQFEVEHNEIFSTKAACEQQMHKSVAKLKTKYPAGAAKCVRKYVNDA